MSDFKYQGYTPMTDEELIEASCDGDVNDTFVDCLRLIEKAVLARLKPDAEPVAYRMQYTYPNGGIYYVYAGKGDVDKLFSQYLTEKTPLYAHPPMNTAERDNLLEQIQAYSDDLRTERYQHEVTKEKLKQNTAERDALVAKIDSEWLAEIIPSDLESLLLDIRAYLVGGGK